MFMKMYNEINYVAHSRKIAYFLVFEGNFEEIVWSTTLGN